MNKIILSERNWRIYHALWLLMVMAVVVDMGAVLMESDLLMSAVATVSAVETSDWLSFSSEAVCLLSLSGLFWLLRNGREVPTRWRNGCLVAFVVTLAYAVTSKLPTLIFGPLSLDDGHWLVDFFNNCADILMLLVPATMIALFMVGASLCERVGKWSVAACCAIAINAPLVVTFLYLSILEDAEPWQWQVVGVLIMVFFSIPVIALRAIATGEDTEQKE